MARKDIRDDRSSVDIKYDSERGSVVRNSGSFTRGSNLLSHQFFMFVGGAKWPFYLLLAMLVFWIFVFHSLFMGPFQMRMVVTKFIYDIALEAGMSPLSPYNLIINDRVTHHLVIGQIDGDPFVINAVHNFWRMVFASTGLALVTTIIPSYLYITKAVNRGQELMKDHHRRGALLLPYEQLRSSILSNNESAARERAKDIFPNNTYEDVIQYSVQSLNDAEFPMPYRIAGIQFPYGLELNHLMLVGTGMTGKTVVFRDLLAQARQREHSAVIFDVTGAFVQAFYDAERDIILNPYDARCPNWDIFQDCENEVQIKTAAMALIPDINDGPDPFWPMAARTLFTEMCLMLMDEGRASNENLIRELMTADLKDIHAKLENTIASPLTSSEASRMAESIRAVFNANADILLSLPSHGKPFSIRSWINSPHKRGGFLFISTRYDDIAVTRSMISLWVNTCIYSSMSRPHSFAIKMWFMLDELGALHQLPSLEHGLQTVRNFGGAIAMGVHDFAQLKQTYGDNGSSKLISMSNNRLFLRVTNPQTAEECSDMIGKREVREMDESYSISNSNARDTSTLTARTEYRPLVLPDDLMNLQNLNGYLKLSDGYPATKVKLQYQTYPKLADGFIQNIANNRPLRVRLVERLGETEGGGVEPKSGAGQQEQNEHDRPEQKPRTSAAVDEKEVLTDATLAQTQLQLVGGTDVHEGDRGIAVPPIADSGSELDRKDTAAKTPTTQLDKSLRAIPPSARRAIDSQAVRDVQRGIGDCDDRPKATKALEQDDLGMDR